jgi:LL-diaminopimelate aminotransferase
MEIINNMIQTASRLNGIGEYYFSKKLREIEALNKQGKNIINLGIGSPDLPPNQAVVEELTNQASLANTHAYQSYKGSQILRDAIANWYQKKYQVVLNAATEILPLIGSKEGIMHICMTYFEAGDFVLIPNPGYPTYTSAVMLSGATPLYYDLQENDNYYPNFSYLETLIEHKKVKAIFCNYPHMPTGTNGSIEVFKQIIAFAKKHQLLVIHDNPYSFILNDEPISILSVDGALDVAIELNSLSKSHNMAGWRVGMMCASEDKINDVLRFKSNMDSGMFLPVQLAAAKALSLNEDWHDELNKEYATRRNLVYELLNMLPCTYNKNQVGMFVWATVNKHFDPHELGIGGALSDKVLYNANVFITPGGIFGTAGFNNIRISLCSKQEQLLKSIERVKAINFLD